MNRKIFVIIPAAGCSSRFADNQTPKQYHKIFNKTVLFWAISGFYNRNDIFHIIVVIAQDNNYDHSDLMQFYPKLSIIKAGGATRAETVKNGVNFIINNFPQDQQSLVLIHDAARCCLHANSLSLLLQQYNPAYVGAILASPITDSLKKAGLINQQLLIQHGIAREDLYAAQTPQLFQIAALTSKMAAQRKFDYTDEASLFDEPGAIQIIINPEPNPKITYQHDISYAQFLLANSGSTDQHRHWNKIIPLKRY